MIIYMMVIYNEKDADQNQSIYISNFKGDYENCPPIMIQVGTEELLIV